MLVEMTSKGTLKFFDEKSGVDTRQHPRIEVQALHKLRVDVLSLHLSAPLTDISLGGFGCVFPELVAANSGQSLRIVLHVEEKKFELDSSIVHTNGKLAGFRFTNLPDAAANAIREYFRLEIQALKMTRIEMNASESEKRVLFRGSSSCELYYSASDAKLESFSISLLGNYIEVEGEAVITMGSVDKQKASNGVSVYTPKAKDRIILDEAIRFVSSIQSLEEIYKQAIIKILEK